MAMHLAGVTTAVASCGTAFGDEHLAMLRRLMMDDKFFRGELIYVFDGDAAGRAAAVKALEGEQQLAGQSFVAVAADGMDPCDLRLAHGDEALRDLVARRTPLFEFAVRTALTEMDLRRPRAGSLRCAVACRWSLRSRTDAARRIRAPVGRLGRLGRRRAGDRPGARAGQERDQGSQGRYQGQRTGPGPSGISCGRQPCRTAGGRPTEPDRSDAVAAA